MNKTMNICYFSYIRQQNFSAAAAADDDDGDDDNKGAFRRICLSFEMSSPDCEWK